MIGIALELGGIISDISKLNIITERRMVISIDSEYNNKYHHLFKTNLRKVNFSPPSGANKNPRIVIQEIKKHGTKKKKIVLTMKE